VRPRCCQLTGALVLALRIRSTTRGRGSASAAAGRIRVVCGSRVFIDHCARRAGPREHGRQAARSKRDRPEREGE
jgi:hypothetical protein